MCQRKENEPWLVYVLRYIQEQPRVVLAGVGLGAACWLYTDMQAMMRTQTEANVSTVAAIEKLTHEVAGVIKEVKENNVRLEHLEREHECARKGVAE